MTTQAVSARRARWPRILAILSALLFVALAFLWIAAAPATPDAFYDAPVKASDAAGRLLRVEPFVHDVPPGARGWRILYVTRRANDAPTLASAVVVVPERTASAPMPVVAWAHGTTGIARGCAPSLMEHPFQNVPAMQTLLERGWAYVATDYPGLGTAGGHAYLVGEDAARAVLDSVRAARQMPQLALDRRFVVWGHSQGGNAALWTGARARDYAPNTDLLGVAALAPAADLPGLADKTRGSLFGRIMDALLATSYAAQYPDIDIANYVGWLWRPLAADIATRCIGDRGSLLSIALAHLAPHSGIFSQSPTEGAFGRRLDENSPVAPIAAPTLIAQGLADDLALPDVQDAYVAARCKAGQAIDYRRYPGRGHVTLLSDGSPAVRDLVDWTAQRFAGAPLTPACP